MTAATKEEQQRMHRRVIGWHDLRFDGIGDLLTRAAGMSVLDLGCNRGAAGIEMAQNGATLVVGVDTYERGIMAAREVTADSRQTAFRFEMFDLTRPISEFGNAVGSDPFDIVLMFAVWHKVLRQMVDKHGGHQGVKLTQDLVTGYGRKALRYVGVRSGAEDQEVVSAGLMVAGLTLVQHSTISGIGPASIWERK